MSQGKCTENCLLSSIDVDSFLPLFHSNTGMLGMNLYKLISLESVPVYGNAIDLGQKCSINCIRQLMLCKQLGDVLHANIRREWEDNA